MIGLATFFLALESTHIVLHSLVLSGKHNISRATLPRRIGYFSSDLLSSVFSFLLCGNYPSTLHTLFVLVHIGVHVLAMTYILDPDKEYPWQPFYKNVFRLARKEKSDNELHTLIYNTMTVQDIVTHGMNVLCLYTHVL